MNENWLPNLDGLPFQSISKEEVAWVEQAFKEREVFEVMKDLNRYKASGPENFSKDFVTYHS